MVIVCKVIIASRYHCSLDIGHFEGDLTFADVCISRASGEGAVCFSCATTEEKVKVDPSPH